MHLLSLFTVPQQYLHPLRIPLHNIPMTWADTRARVIQIPRFLYPQPHRIPPNDMIQVDNATPLLDHGKGTPRLLLETQAAPLSPLSMAENNFQPTIFVRDEDGGIQLAQADQHGDFVEILPPVYSF